MCLLLFFTLLALFLRLLEIPLKRKWFPLDINADHHTIRSSPLDIINHIPNLVYILLLYVFIYYFDDTHEIKKCMREMM